MKSVLHEVTWKIILQASRTFLNPPEPKQLQTTREKRLFREKTSKTKKKHIHDYAHTNLVVAYLSLLFRLFGRSSAPWSVFYLKLCGKSSYKPPGPFQTLEDRKKIRKNGCLEKECPKENENTCFFQSGKFQNLSRKIPWNFQEMSTKISEKLLGNEISKKFPRKLNEISRTYPRNVQENRKKCPGSFGKISSEHVGIIV